MQKNLTNIFYAIGAIVVLTGIIILVAQHWHEIGFIGRLLVTAGVAAVAYAAGLIFRSPEQRTLSQVFFTIAAVLAPMGAYVILTENEIGFGLVEQAIIAVGLAILFGFARFLTQGSVLVLYVIFYLTWAYYTILLKALEQVAYVPSDLLTWATVVAGIAYVLIGYAYREAQTTLVGEREGRSVKTILYGLGTLAALGAGISLNGVWDIAYIPLLFVAFYLGVFLRTRTMLVLAALFLIAHLIYLTSEYFADVTGWPIALIICGFIIIGIGYGTFYVMRKYMR